MVITKEILEKLGFDNNHPDYVLSKWYKHSKDKNPEWRVSVETEYITGTNELAYKVFCWKCNDKGFIVKRCDASYIKTTEELNKILDICEMPWAIDDSSL